MPPDEDKAMLAMAATGRGHGKGPRLTDTVPDGTPFLSEALIERVVRVEESVKAHAIDIALSREARDEYVPQIIQLRANMDVIATSVTKMSNGFDEMRGAVRGLTNELHVITGERRIVMRILKWVVALLTAVLIAVSVSQVNRWIESHPQTARVVGTLIGLPMKGKVGL